MVRICGEMVAQNIKFIISGNQSKVTQEEKITQKEIQKEKCSEGLRTRERT